MSFIEDFVAHFAEGIKLADAKRPTAVNRRSKKPFRPGIGPHSESAVVELVGDELEARRPEIYAGRWHTNIPYPELPRQRCDLCLGDGANWDWAIEVKMLRFLGDNGKVNDNILMHILSPYPQDRSALTDCEKLRESRLAPSEAILIFGYDHEDWPLDPAIDAFELLAREKVELGRRAEARFDDLVHPVHRHGRVFGWALR